MAGDSAYMTLTAFKNFLEEEGLSGCTDEQVMKLYEKYVRKLGEDAIAQGFEQIQRAFYEDLKKAQEKATAEITEATRKVTEAIEQYKWESELHAAVGAKKAAVEGFDYKTPLQRVIDTKRAEVEGFVERFANQIANSKEAVEKISADIENLRTAIKNKKDEIGNYDIRKDIGEAVSARVQQYNLQEDISTVIEAAFQQVNGQEKISKAIKQKAAEILNHPITEVDNAINRKTQEIANYDLGPLKEALQSKLADLERQIGETGAAISKTAKVVDEQERETREIGPRIAEINKALQKVSKPMELIRELANEYETKYAANVKRIVEGYQKNLEAITTEALKQVDEETEKKIKFIMEAMKEVKKG